MATEHFRPLLSDVTVCRELSITQRTLQRWLREEIIQPPIGKIAKNRRGWSPAEVQLIREQIDARRQPDQELL